MFKKGIKSEAKKYRPISLLPLISKVIEKSINDQTQDYLRRNEMLYIYQSGFRANHSTDTCLSRLTDMTLNGAEIWYILLVWFNRSSKGFWHLGLLNFIRKNEVHWFSRWNNKMVSFLPHKPSLFRFIGQCVFGSRDHKLQTSSRIYIRTFTTFVAYKWYSTNPVRKSHIPVHGRHWYFSLT